MLGLKLYRGTNGTFLMLRFLGLYFIHTFCMDCDFVPSCTQNTPKYTGGTPVIIRGSQVMETAVRSMLGDSYNWPVEIVTERKKTDLRHQNKVK